MDNGTYFKAQVITTWLKDHPKLKLGFLPPYEPNLNLIERFWRFVKEHLVQNTYDKKYKTFRAKVFQLLNHVNEHTVELKTLMEENFEIMKKSINYASKNRSWTTIYRNFHLSKAHNEI